MRADIQEVPEKNTEFLILEKQISNLIMDNVMKKPTARTIVQQGFSLVELLVVIAVIAVIAAIAIPNIANITGAAGEAKNQRNAQNIANLAAAARAAGHTNTYTDAAAWVGALTSSNGIRGAGSTQLSNTVFRVDAMSAADQTAVVPYLRMSGSNATSVLIYVPDATGATTSSN